MLDGIFTFLFGLAVGIVLTIVAEVIIIFAVVDKFISLIMGKEKKEQES